MPRRRLIAVLPRLTFLLALSACGGGGGGAESPLPPLATVRTLAYVVTQCREDATRRVFHQELRIQNGGRAPVVVAPTDTYVQEPPVLPGLCRFYGTSHIGGASVFVGPFERLAVSPDGSAVVFEKTTRFSISRLPPLAPNEDGFFFVRADGSGLRWLGPPSRESLTRAAQGGLRFLDYDDTVTLSFSADGRTVAFSDRGPGPADEDAAQVVTLDLATGVRFQVTRLPQAPINPASIDLYSVRFLPDGTIIFNTRANLDGRHPGFVSYTVNPDGTGLTLIPLPVILPGGHIDPNFQITGNLSTAVGLGLPDGTSEMFLLDGRNLLQLTNFRRPDTLSGTLDADRQRVFFLASANPPELHGSNPSENCQIFSIDTLGTDLRQLTDFSQGGHSAFGCGAGVGGHLPPGCIIERPRQDPMTGAIVFPSSCDPFVGMNPNGSQLFAVYPDGTGLQQLTDTSGFTTEADGTVDVELPGPFASTAVRR